MRKLLSSAVAISMILSIPVTSFATEGNYESDSNVEYSVSRSSGKKIIASDAFYGMKYQKWSEDGKAYYKFEMPGGVLLGRVDSDYDANKVRSYIDEIKEEMKNYNKLLRITPPGYDKYAYRYGHQERKQKYLKMVEYAFSGEQTYRYFTMYDMFNESYMRGYERNEGSNDAQEILLLDYLMDGSNYSASIRDEDVKSLTKVMKSTGKLMKHLNKINNKKYGYDLYKSCGLEY